MAHSGSSPIEPAADAGGGLLDLAAARALPKVELHLHLESCVEAAALAELAARLGAPLPCPAEDIYRFDTLAELLVRCEWWCDLFRTAEIAEGIAYGNAARLHADGVVYAEVMAGPRYWPHLTYDVLLAALCRGFDRAAADGLTDCRLIPTISRDQPPDWAEELVGWIGADGPQRIVGLGVDGDEHATGRTSPGLAPAYERAAGLGLGRTAHAGESSGPAGVRDALDLLGAQRIDHGVRAIEDPALVERLAAETVTLNVCATANIRLGLFPTLEAHPIGYLIDAGVPVTVNSDDCMALGISLPGELAMTAGLLGWTAADARAAMLRAVDAAFCDDARKRELRAAVG